MTWEYKFPGKYIIGNAYSLGYIFPKLTILDLNNEFHSERVY